MEDFGFKFNIGDDLAHAASIREADRLNQSKDSKFGAFRPARLTVIERVLQQCHGGVQRFYQVRAISVQADVMGVRYVAFSAVQSADGTFRLIEPELETYPAAAS